MRRSSRRTRPALLNCVAALFALDAPADAALWRLSTPPHTREELANVPSGARSASVTDPATLDASLAELARVQAIGRAATPAASTPKVIPLTPFPLTTMVLNVTNQ